MRIYCIEKNLFKYDDLHICSHQNYMQMINHQINKKRVGFCLLFSTLFSSILGLVHNIPIISA